MEIQSVHICDYATTSAEGKASIIGIFDTLYCAQFPAIQPLFFICLRLGVSDQDIGETVAIRITIVDPEGQEIFGTTGTIRISDNAPVRPIAFNARVVNLVFLEPGPFHITVDVASETRTLELSVGPLDDGQQG